MSEGVEESVLQWEEEHEVGRESAERVWGLNNTPEARAEDAAVGCCLVPFAPTHMLYGAVSVFVNAIEDSGGIDVEGSRPMFQHVRGDAVLG